MREGFKGLGEMDKSKPLVYEEADQQFYKSALKVAESRPFSRKVKETIQEGNLFFPNGKIINMNKESENLSGFS